MAEITRARNIPITRDKLAQFLQSHQAVKWGEDLQRQVGDDLPAQIDGALLLGTEAGQSAASARSAADRAISAAADARARAEEVAVLVAQVTAMVAATRSLQTKVHDLQRQVDDLTARLLTA